MPGDDPDDHVHAAAAVARSPCVILTRNTADFPPLELAGRGVTVLDPDDYLVGLFEEHGDEMVSIVQEMAADRRRPPMTASEIVDALERAGVRQFAAAARERLTR